MMFFEGKKMAEIMRAGTLVDLRVALMKKPKLLNLVTKRAGGKEKLSGGLLHMAAAYNRPQFIQFLVKEKGMNVNDQSSSKGKLAPMHHAACNNAKEAILMLQSLGAKADIPAADGSKPEDKTESGAIKRLLHPQHKLLQGMMIGTLADVRDFVEKNPDVLQQNFEWQNGGYGGSLLHMAAYYNHPDIIAYLVKEKGMDVNGADKSGWTPLHHAAERNAIGASTKLLDLGANASLKNAEGQRPAELCREASLKKLLSDSHEENRKVEKAAAVAKRINDYAHIKALKM